MLTQERLKEVLHYDPETGIFTRIERHRGIHLGSVAGTIRPDGYRSIMIDNRRYRAARLAFLYMLGRWPNPEADHVDRNPANDRWKNLRDATSSEQKQNRGMISSNTSGFKGVIAFRGRWRADIGINGKIKYLGTFDTPEIAGAAYAAAKRTLHPFSPEV